MPWTYRIIRHHHSQEWFGLHEAFYDTSGTLKGISPDPVDFVADRNEGPQSIVAEMGKALAIAQANPILDEDDIPRC